MTIKQQREILERDLAYLKADIRARPEFYLELNKALALPMGAERTIMLMKYPLGVSNMIYKLANMMIAIGFSEVKREVKREDEGED
jgi:hypothetical protein